MFVEYQITFPMNKFKRLLSNKEMWLIVGKDIDFRPDVYDTLIITDDQGIDAVEAMVISDGYIRHLRKWAVKISMDTDVDPVKAIRNHVSFGAYESGEAEVNAIDWSSGGKLSAWPQPGMGEVFPPNQAGLIWDPSIE